MKKIFLDGIGSKVPSNILTNHDLEEMVETSDEWITSRTGISERRIALEDITTGDLAYQASLNALEKSKINAKDLDLIVVGTSTPDYYFPSIAAILQGKLDCRNIPAFDLSAACSGFIYSLSVVKEFITAGKTNNCLAVGSDCLSKVTNWEDRSTCVLFGDGAGATVVSSNKPTSDFSLQLLDTELGTDGTLKDLLYIKGPGSKDSQKKHLEDCYLVMEGKKIFKHAIKRMSEVTMKILDRFDVSPSEISLVVPHQANRRIIVALAQNLGINIERFVINIDRYGNTSAATIPLALEEALLNGRIKKDSYILLVAFGGGLTWGAALLKSV